MAYTVTITEVGSEISVNESSYPVTVSYNAIELEGIGEAPLDGKQYARKNAEWQVVVGDGTGGGGGIEEAPSDGKTYGRKDETWEEVESIEEAPEDGRQYARKDRQWSEFEAGESTVANGCIHLNNKVLVDDYTIPTDKNGFSAGPIDFQGTVTVPTGSAYYVVDEELTPVSYTITEVDTLMLDKQDLGVSYTKTETDSLLENAVDLTDVYTKTETDSLLETAVDLTDVYTKAETDSLVENAVDLTDVYTKAETDSLLENAVDSNSGSDLVTLSTAGNAFRFLNSSTQYPSSNQFSANDNNTATNNTWHFYNLKSEKGGNVLCNEYEATNNTMLEIWSAGDLRLKTTLRAWEPSVRNDVCIQAICSGPKPSTSLGATFASNGLYDIIVTNLRKKK